jgi:FtsP/CotA-like multicopper oxidase with cupredoxin domain
MNAENALPMYTTVHFPGIRLPNAMDRVARLTQPPIAKKGGRFMCAFADACTFWYHRHPGSPEQVGRGLYGALIVEEREPRAVEILPWRLPRRVDSP